MSRSQCILAHYSPNYKCPDWYLPHGKRIQCHVYDFVWSWRTLLPITKIQNKIPTPRKSITSHPRKVKESVKYIHYDIFLSPFMFKIVRSFVAKLQCTLGEFGVFHLPNDNYLIKTSSNCIIYTFSLWRSLND